MSLNIDVTDFVEAGREKTSLQFEDEKQQATFELGVTISIHDWDALKTAVDNQWGGPDSSEKRDWISSVIIDLFANERAIDIAVIEETLLYAMADEFDTHVEDDSALITAKRVFDLYKECEKKEYGHIKEAYATWSANQAKKTVKKVVVQEDPDNPDDSEDDDEDEVPELVDEDVHMEVDEVQKVEPVVDDDGFELVQKKGRKNRRA